MRNYILADLNRIFRSIPRHIILAVFYVLTIGIIFNTAIQDEYNSLDLTSSTALPFTLIGFIIGMIEFLTIFAADFKAKTMQIAIGIGVSRPKVVLAKLIEYTVLALYNSILFALLIIIGGICCGIPLLGDQLFMLIVSAVGCAIGMVIPASLTMIPVFYTQSTGLAAILYLIIAIDPVAQLLKYAFGSNELVLNLHLQERTFSYVSTTLTSQISLGLGFPVSLAFGVVFYIALGYALTVLFFNKRELEF